MPDSLRRGRRRPEPTPAQRALALLVRREHSRRELERKLAARGVGPEDAARAVERMAAEGWQDDTRFAASLARSRASAGYGPLRIRIELESHGLDAGVVEAAFAALAEDGEDDWDASARELVARRFGEFGPEDAGRRRKAAEFLIRRGFGIGSARRATGFDPED
ncbi:regulatory protein RecX [Luteimonas sp. RD2P54]|uniref:Regulatory protein RecX n=1 Tax=Luteimonas endophytica TaxID=3042023 RepID=A0ABT6JBN3_9GAMM|nr:regulatory protein RecX [Luteimonas endophytica]MDH5824236.1 regulatory protein RecX [Luteimonas endophytica]